MRSPIFLLILFAIAYAASKIDPTGTSLNGFVFNGLASGLFALLGVVFGIADERLLKRLGIAAVGALGLCCVFILRPRFNGWELLLSVCRMIVFSAAFIWVRHSRNVVFTHRRTSPVADLGRLRLSHLFGFTTAVAVFLSAVRLLNNYNGPGGAAFLVAVTVFVGISGAMIPLLAATATLGQRDLSAAPLFAAAILMLSVCMGAFGFSQTDSWRTGLLWSLGSLFEALTIAGAILTLRFVGYQLKRLEPSTSRI